MSQTLQKIRDAEDTKTKTVKVEEWGIELTLIEPVRRIIVAMQEKYMRMDPATGMPMPGSDADKFGMAMLVEMVHDIDGKKVFADEDGKPSIAVAEEVLDEKSQRILTKLVEQCGELVRLPTEGDVEEAEGN